MTFAMFIIEAIEVFFEYFCVRGKLTLLIQCLSNLGLNLRISSNELIHAVLSIFPHFPFHFLQLVHYIQNQSPP